MSRTWILKLLLVSLVTLFLTGCALAVADKYFKDKEKAANAEESSASSEGLSSEQSEMGVDE